jgi:hypothetical protein
MSRSSSSSFKSFTTRTLPNGEIQLHQDQATCNGNNCPDAQNCLRYTLNFTHPHNHQLNGTSTDTPYCIHRLTPPLPASQQLSSFVSLYKDKSTNFQRAAKANVFKNRAKLRRK